MAQHKAPTAVTIAPTASESAFRHWIVRYWKLGAVITALIVVWIVYQAQQKSAQKSLAQESWKKLLAVVNADPNSGVLVGAPDDLRRIEGEVSGSPAGPWALYMAATSAASAKEFEKARATLEDLKKKYPQHSLVTEPLFSDGTGPSLSAVQSLTAKIEAQVQFTSSNPSLFSNPDLPPDAPKLRLTTDKGVIVVGLYSNLAPKLAENFIKLSKDGFYNGTKFHVIVQGQYIRGGDPDSVKGEPSTWGNGGPGYSLEKENIPLRHFAGVLSATPDAKDQSKTSGSQFLITTGDAHNLDDAYVVFGKVLEGLDTARLIQSGPIVEDTVSQPKEPATLLTVEVL